MEHWEQLLTASTTEQNITHNNNNLHSSAQPDFLQSQTFPCSEANRIDNLLQSQSDQPHQQQHQPYQQQQPTYDVLLDLSSLSSYSYADYVSQHQEEAITTNQSNGLMDHPNTTVGAPYHLQFVPSQSSSDLQQIQHMMSQGYDFSDFGSYLPSSEGYYAFELPNYAPTFTTTTNDAADATTVPIADVPAADVPVSKIMIDHGENLQPPPPQHHEPTKLSCSEPNCTSQFATQPELDTHLVTKHYHNNKKVVTQSNQQLFSCNHEKCTKSFKARSDLKRHARIHRNVRPYQCTWEKCEYRGGKDRQTVLNHIRVIHLNIRGVGERVSRMNGGPDPRDYLKVIKEWL